MTYDLLLDEVMVAAAELNKLADEANEKIKKFEEAFTGCEIEVWLEINDRLRIGYVNQPHWCLKCVKWVTKNRISEDREACLLSKAPRDVRIEAAPYLEDLAKLMLTKLKEEHARLAVFGGDR